MTDAHVSAAYFDTPARAERLQLLLHLIRNVGEVIYLRAPAGAGKTRFARRLVDVAADEAACVWLRGGIDSDVGAVTASQLGLTAHDVADWPNGVIRALSGQDPLVVVDDADHLGLAAIERLAALHAAGGRLLLVGHGGLAQTTRQWDVHYVDLPPFDAEQSATFLRGNAGDEAEHINDDLAAFLHHAAHGRPGALLDSLQEVLARARHQAEQRNRRRVGPSRPRWPWLAGGLAALAIVAVLIFQAPINALFEPAPEARVPTAEQPSVLAPDPQPEAARDDITESAAIAELATADEPLAVVPAMPQPAPVEGMDDGDRPGEVTDMAAGADATELPTAADAPPQIALPQLSRLPSLTPDAQAPGAAGNADGDDLPDAVMRDALRADESAATAAEQATAPGPVTVGDTPADSDRSVSEAAPPAAPVATAAQVETPDLPATPAVPADDRVTTPAAPAAENAVGSTDGAAPVEERVAGRPAAAEPAKPVPPAAAPVDDRSRAVSSAPAAVGPVPAPAEAATGPEPTSASPAAATGSDWLQTRPSSHYTLQLVGARDRAAVEKFIRTHEVAPPYAIFQRPLNGSPWYSLVAGDYVDREAAVAARARLPATLAASDIWPRSFESVKKSMQ